MNRRTMVARPGSASLLTAVMLFPDLLDDQRLAHPDDRDMRKSPPNLIPVHGTLEGYSRRPPPAAALPRRRACSSALGTVALTLLLAAPAGYSLAKLRPRGGGALSFVLLIAQMIPGDRHGDGLLRHLPQARLLNTLPGLIVADSTIAVPFGVLIFTAFMSRIPDELLQAARIDGAGYLRTFRSIVLPVSRNSIVTVSLFAFLWAWSDFIFANTLDSGGKLQPITLGIYALHRQQQPAVERHHGHRRRRLDPGHRPARSSRSATSPPA